MSDDPKEPLMPDLPEPTRWFRGAGEDGEDVSVPVWETTLLGEVVPWTRGLSINDDYGEATVDQIREAGLALLAVARHKRHITGDATLGPP